MSGSSNNGFSKPLNGFVIALSLTATVFVAPGVWPAIHEPVWFALLDRYSVGVARWLYWIGEIATYPLTYFAIHLALGICLFALARIIKRHNQ